MSLKRVLLAIIIGTFIGIVTAQINLAPMGVALQSSTYPWYPANLAIEGPANNKLKDGCSVTAAVQTYAWWGLRLPAVAHITNILIYYRENYAGRMDGFSLYLENGTTVGSSILNRCYTDQGKPGLPALTQNITCNTLAKDMYFVNRRSDATCYVELCYVAIYGCFKGTWNSNCTEPCPATCLGHNCYPQNGSCVWGCDTQNCLNKKCDINTGACIDGCIALRAGQFCNKYNLASNSTATQHQPKSNHPASFAIDGNRTNGLCSMTTGPSSYLQVDTGSLSVVTTVYFTFGDGTVTTGEDTLYCSNTSDSWNNAFLIYKGGRPTKDINVFAVCRYILYLPPTDSGVDVCEIEIGGCPHGRYGDNCEKFCHCNGPYDLGSGYCTSGCFDGWTGYRCDIACDNGNFGNECSRYCSANCLNQTCNHITGECTGGCNKGWEGYNCTKECDVGYFGTNCSQTCFGCITNQCDKTNGVCSNLSGCKPGFVKGQNCNQECEDWKYGKDCAKKCNCRTLPCNKFNGLCSNGECAKGWHSNSCDTECDNGFYDFNCKLECTTCLNMSCDIFEGHCSYGCIDRYKGVKCKGNFRVGCNDGYHGRKCETKVSAGSLSLIKSSFFMGGFASMLGILLIILTVVVARRRMLKKQEIRKGLDNSPSHSNEQHYDDIMNMESVYTYQELAKPTINLSSDYDQINNAYTNQ